MEANVDGDCGFVQDAMCGVSSSFTLLLGDDGAGVNSGYDTSRRCSL